MTTLKALYKKAKNDLGFRAALLKVQDQNAVPQPTWNDSRKAVYAATYYGYLLGMKQFKTEILNDTDKDRKEEVQA